MSDLESLLSLLEVCEGSAYLEILFSFPLPYELVLKYETMRQRTFEKLKIPHSSSKIWKQQRDVNSKQKLKTSRRLEDPGNDCYSKTETSHEVTLKYANSAEERFFALQKIFAKLQSLVDSNVLPGVSKPSCLDELEVIRFKDWNRFREMEIIELRLLEHMSRRSVNKESDFLVLIERVKDKMLHYDSSVRSLETHIDNMHLQNLNKENELKAEIQELLAKLEIQKLEIENLRSSKFEQSERVNENLNLTCQIAYLKNTIDDINRKGKNSSDRYLDEINKLQLEIDLIKQKSVDSSRRKYDKLHELLEAIKEITHNVFMKYGLSHSEWQDNHWKQELENYDEEFGDTLVEIEFLCFMIAKLTSDNNWLVDRLSDIGSRKSDLKGSPRKLKAEVMSDLKATSEALKEFEEARDKLISQFIPE